MKVLKSEIYKLEKIEVLIRSYLANKSNGVLDTNLEWTLEGRRQEIIRYLDQEFIGASYGVDHRREIYVLLLALFVSKLDAIKLVISKLLASENDEDAKRLLSRMLK